MKKNKKSKTPKYYVENVSLIAASQLELSEEAWEELRNSNQITWGDANRTLYTVKALLEEVDLPAADEAKLEAVAKAYGELQYIDLEN